MNIACIIPTFKGYEHVLRLLDSLECQTVSFDCFIIDSSSNDGTAELAHSRAVNFTQISPSDFNHGATRQFIIDHNPGYDIYVFLTQDSYLFDSDSLSQILIPFSDPEVGAVCGRQLPHLDASPISQHARYFNYPNCSLVKSRTDIPVHGIKTAFMSNSFAAYRNSALKTVGGFPFNVIFAEDMYVAAKMVLSGWKVAYNGNAICYHSHNYTFIEEFQRYFDMGVFHSREPWIRSSFGGAGGEGIKYLISEFKFLGISRFYLIPSAFIRNALKFIAYKIGQHERFIPIFIKRKLGMLKKYWDGPFASGLLTDEG